MGDILEKDGDPSPTTDVEIETPNKTNRSKRYFFDRHRNDKSARTINNNLGTRSPEDDSVEDDHISVNREQKGGTNILSATSAALTRFKGMTIRSGSSGRTLNPRWSTLGSSFSSPSPSRTEHGSNDSPSPRQISLHVGSGTKNRDSSREASAPERDGDNISASESAIERDTHRSKLSVIFDDDDNDGDREGDIDMWNNAAESDDSGGNTPSAEQDKQEHADDMRSNWASTLMASTLAREKSTGKPSTVRGRVDLLPHPRDASNKVQEHRVSITGGITGGSHETVM